MRGVAEDGIGGNENGLRDERVQIQRWQRKALNTASRCAGSTAHK